MFLLSITKVHVCFVSLNTSSSCSQSDSARSRTCGSVATARQLLALTHMHLYKHGIFVHVHVDVHTTWLHWDGPLKSASFNYSYIYCRCKQPFTTPSNKSILPWKVEKQLDKVHIISSKRSLFLSPIAINVIRWISTYFCNMSINHSSYFSRFFHLQGPTSNFIRLVVLVIDHML